MKIKKHIQFVCRAASAIMLGLVACPAMGQDLIQRPVAKEDYKLWSTLKSDKISDDAHWVSYYLRYESHLDTLFVKSTQSETIYSFAGSSEGRFGSSQLFACMGKNEELHFLELSSGKTQQIPNVKKYDFTVHGQQLVTLENGTPQTLDLCIRNSAGMLVQKISNVTEYACSPKGDALIYIRTINGVSSSALITFHQSMAIKNIIENSAQEIKNLTWSEDGTAAVFYLGETGAGKLLFYNRAKGDLTALENLPPEIFPDKIIAYNTSIPLRISDDNQAVFFCYRSARQIEAKSSPSEIWNTADKYLYPKSQPSKTASKPYLAVWHPLTGLLRPLSSEKMSWAALTGDQKHAVLGNPSQYEPYYDLHAPMDYYLMDINSGKKELLAVKLSGHIQHMNFSPDGRFICYYKNSSWQVYDITKKKHTDITAGFDSSFISSIEDPYSRKTDSYIFHGWSADSRSVLLCDQYDIWQVSITGQKRSRLTHGREKQHRFRFESSFMEKYSKSNYSGATPVSVNTQRANLLEAYDMRNGASGYYFLNPNGVMRQLIFSSAKISSPRKAADRDAFIFTSENYDSSPTLLYKDAKQSEIKVLAESNLQQKNFYWGSSEMIHFENAWQKQLNGALFYPAQYDPKLKYPMIVYIYDKLSHMVHNYENPSNQSQFGFNITYFTSKGYLVLLPDIAYVTGDPGISAAECVESAVRSVIAKGLADPSKIGLIGHSFGAYQANFIMTKSNLFAAAVSGAGVSDNVRAYFTVSSEYHNAEAWRFENQQYRMGASFYEEKAAYFRNSPLLNAENIRSPILLWTGKKDQNVLPAQSEAFYLALRRLGKKSVMLQYPNEGHILKSAAAREDLNDKILQWFDYYLKNSATPEWMSSNGTETGTPADQ